MKIGMLCYPTYGGSGIVATELGKALAKKGHEVHFISNSLPARLDVTQPNIFFHRVYIQPYPLFQFQPYEIALSSSIYRVATMYSLDILHAHYAIPYAYSAFMARQMLLEDGITIPLITTLHGTDITLVGQHPSYKPAVEFCINKSNAITSVSDSLKSDTVNFFNVTKEIQVIPNFIDLKEYDEMDPNHPNHHDLGCWSKEASEDDLPVLIHVSNLRPVKRIKDVLEIFKQVDSIITCKLIIAGEGPDMEVVHSFMQDNPELIPRIRLLGKVQDIVCVLRAADIFLLPSEQESFGLAALEAMAAGLVVISSNAGGLPEVNVDGQSGFVSDVGNVGKMVHDTLTLLQDPELLLSMKVKARSIAETFTIERILPLYENLYFQQINTNNKQAEQV